MHLRHDIRPLLGHGVTITVTRGVIDHDRRTGRGVYTDLLDADGLKVIDGAAQNAEAETAPPPEAPEH